MNRLAIPLAALCLAGCAGTGASNTVQVALADGSLGADTAYNSAASWYLANVSSFSPSLKATLKGALLKVQTCPPGATVTVAQCTGYLPAYHHAVAIGDTVAQAGLLNSIGVALKPVVNAKNGAAK